MISLGRILILSLGVAFLCTTCQKSKPKTQKLGTVTKQVVKAFEKPTFTPPSDSLIRPEALKSWMLVNPALDSFAIANRDSFTTKDAVRYQERFMVAQDKICVRYGLAGGYAEYLWILKARANPLNKKLVASMTISGE